MLECIYFFVIGAFIGWMLECVFKFATKNYEKTPGILNTPFCILYGLGTVALSLIINKTTDNIWLLFIYSMIILTAMEYVTYILLKKIYGIKLWDYKDMTFSINEKVCLEFALVWGALGAIYIKYILPILTSLYIKAKGVALEFALQLILAIIIADFIYSSYTLITNKKSKKLQEESHNG